MGRVGACEGAWRILVLVWMVIGFWDLRRRDWNLTSYMGFLIPAAGEPTRLLAGVAAWGEGRGACASGTSLEVLQAWREWEPVRLRCESWS